MNSISKLSYQEKIKLAKDPNTTVELLKVLSTDKDLYVRCWVARHPNTPVEILKVLSTDKHPDVRCWVAQHPNTPVEVLKVLSVEVLKVLAADESSAVRCGVARHSNIPVELLKVLATDENPDVQSAAKQNPNYKSKTLELTEVQYEALKKLIESGHDESLKDLI